MAVLRLFAAAREAAGTGSTEIGGSTVGEVLDEASRRFGGPFVAVLETSRIWLDGEPADLDDPVDDDVEVAVLPPISGGS